MYKIVNADKKTYAFYQYASEAEYERMVVDHADQIFGRKGIYFDIKKRIGKPKKGAAIPDGYYLDLILRDNPTLYFVEVELSNHDVYGHIGEQVLRFAISSEIDKHKIKKILIEDINSDDEKQMKLKEFFDQSPYNNINELLDKLIFEDKVSVIIVIDQSTEELDRVLSKIVIPSEVIEAQSYSCGKKVLHRFSLFQDELIADLPQSKDYDELDTIVVPAREDGFIEEFMNNHRWYAIRISSTMLEKIKYIAAYQVAPVSAITHVAEVDRIEKYQDTNKYIVFFKEGTTKRIAKIGLSKGKGNLAPQAPRYTSSVKLNAAKTLSDLWR